MRGEDEDNFKSSTDQRSAMDDSAMKISSRDETSSVKIFDEGQTNDDEKQDSEEGLTTPKLDGDLDESMTVEALSTPTFLKESLRMAGLSTSLMGLDLTTSSTSKAGSTASINKNECNSNNMNSEGNKFIRLISPVGSRNSIVDPKGVKLVSGGNVNEDGDDSFYDSLDFTDLLAEVDDSIASSTPVHDFGQNREGGDEIKSAAISSGIAQIESVTKNGKEMDMTDRGGVSKETFDVKEQQSNSRVNPTPDKGSATTSPLTGVPLTISHLTNDRTVSSSSSHCVNLDASSAPSAALLQGKIKLNDREENRRRELVNEAPLQKDSEIGDPMSPFVPGAASVTTADQLSIASTTTASSLMIDMDGKANTELSNQDDSSWYILPRNNGNENTGGSSWKWWEEPASLQHQLEPLSQNRVGGKYLQISSTPSGITSVRLGEDTFRVCASIPKCTVREVMAAASHPNWLPLWVHCIKGRVHVTNESGFHRRNHPHNSSWKNDREIGFEEETMIDGRYHYSPNEYDAEWIEASACLQNPGGMVCGNGGCYNLCSRIARLVGGSLTGRLTLYVEKRRGQIGLTIAPVGGAEVLHTMKFEQVGVDVHIKDTVRIDRNLDQAVALRSSSNVPMSDGDEDDWDVVGYDERSGEDRVGYRPTLCGWTTCLSKSLRILHRRLYAGCCCCCVNSTCRRWILPGLVGHVKQTIDSMESLAELVLHGGASIGDGLASPRDGGMAPLLEGPMI